MMLRSSIHVYGLNGGPGQRLALERRLPPVQPMEGRADLVRLNLVCGELKSSSEHLCFLQSKCQ
jgi:hypothetical protein